VRISNRSIGVFVPATWSIPENPFLGPGMAGLRDFVKATFSLPPQPAGIGRLNDFVNATFSLPPQPAGIGDFAPAAAMYPIPQNSVLVAAGLAGLKGDCGCGCNGSGGCGGGLHGISDDLSAMWTNVTSGNWSAASTNFFTLLSEPVFGTIPLWMPLGGGLLLWALVFSGGEHSRYTRARKASSAARRAYA